MTYEAIALLQTGEVLTAYASCGLVLLPLSYLRWRWVPLALGPPRCWAAALLSLNRVITGFWLGMMVLGFGAAGCAGAAEEGDQPGSGKKIDQ